MNYFGDFFSQSKGVTMHPLTLSPTTAFDVAGAALIVAALVSQTKFLLQLAIPTGATYQDSSVRLYVWLISLATVVFIDWTNNTLTSRADALAVLSTSFAVAAVAIGSYHVLTTDAPIAAAVAVPSPAPVVPVIAETKPTPVIPPVEVAPQG